MLCYAKLLQSCPTLCDPIDSSPLDSLCPWDSPGKNTGAGCHFLLQCMKVKSEREVAQSCPTLSDPMDCSSPGSSAHGIFQARVLEWGATALQYLENIHNLLGHREAKFKYLKFLYSRLVLSSLLQVVVVVVEEGVSQLIPVSLCM